MHLKSKANQPPVCGTKELLSNYVQDQMPTRAGWTTFFCSGHGLANVHVASRAKGIGLSGGDLGNAIINLSDVSIALIL